MWTNTDIFQNDIFWAISCVPPSKFTLEETFMEVKQNILSFYLLFLTFIACLGIIVDMNILTTC